MLNNLLKQNKMIFCDIFSFGITSVDVAHPLKGAKSIVQGVDMRY